MKKLCILAVGALFAITTAVSAQAPGQKPENEGVKREMKKGDNPRGDKQGPQDVHHGDKGHRNCPQGKHIRKGGAPIHHKGEKPCPKDKGKEMPPKR